MKTLFLTLLFDQFGFCAFGAVSASPEITEITLERTACFGTCPVYVVTLHSDGTVIYEGKEFVKEVGRRSGKISTQQFQQLVSKVQQIRFFTLKDDYLTKVNSDGSVIAITDLPTSITTLKRGQDSKTVKNYFGGPEG